MIPDNVSIQLPVLRLLEDRKPHRIREVIEKMANHFQLTSSELNEKTPIAKRSKFETRVMWAVSQLRNSGLLENIERGIFKITKRGLEVLEKNPKVIDNSVLKKFPEYRIFLGLEGDKSTRAEVNENVESPLEILENNYKKLKQDLLQELLSQIKKISPFKFEKVVITLLLKMGYGGPSQIGLVTQKSRDGGIDGIINEDELGLGKIYIQAKRWENQVTEPQIHQFVGALDGQNAKKGIFITTSYFTPDASEYAKKIIGKDIVLIDGTQLSELLFKYDLGVSKSNNYEIKKIDVEFFDDVD